MTRTPLITIGVAASAAALSGAFGLPTCPKYDHACEIMREAMHGEPTPPYSPMPTHLGKSVMAATTSLSDTLYLQWTFAAT